MRAAQILALAAALPSALATVYKGFNYGATFSDGSLKHQADFENEFRSAKNMQWTDNTFTSARLFTTIQGDTNGPISAIPAAIATQTSLLLGIWASAGQQNIDMEINALVAAISQYGTAFTDLIVGISVGSEDLYRLTELGIASNVGPGATADQLSAYITQVRNAIANTPAAGKPIGHVDTYNSYTNSSNAGIISAVDFIGVDAYPYYESTKANSIDNAANLFFDDYNQVVAIAQGKPVWVTETGWPIQGPQSGAAVAGIDNAARYYSEVGCKLFSTGVNAWWFILQDQQPVTPAVVFGVAGAGSPPPTVPLYSLAC